MRRNRVQNSREADSEPLWFSQALDIYRDAHRNPSEIQPDQPGSKAFIQRCRKGADIARRTAQLRRERERIGFVPLSFSDYLKGLAKLVGSPLPPVMGWFGVTDSRQIDRASAPGVARLGRELGLSLQELLAHVRIGFAEAHGTAPISMLAARSTDGRDDPLRETEDALRQVELKYNPTQLHELRLIESELRSGFGKAIPV
jgi:hypothetical protein